jgi:uncharacterized membrane protein
MNKISAKKIARIAIIAALYAVCTFIFAPISYGAIQFRISECLCVLAFFSFEGVIGLTIGCFIANIFGNGPLDLVFGTLATLLASLCAFKTAKIIKNELARFFVCAIYPIIFNAVIIPFTFLLITELKELYFISMLQVAVGQATVILTLGLFLYLALNKRIAKTGGSVFKKLH